MSGPSPTPREVVLVGGGHAHVQVLKSFGLRPAAGTRLTLVAKEIEAPYSGMLPGFVAGHYRHDDVHIDLKRLARRSGARLIHDAAIGIDRENRHLLLAGHPPLAYDLLSLDVGITPDLDGIAGAAGHGIAVKPISEFAPRWRKLKDAAAGSGGPRRICVIGGGAAGFELVLAARRALSRPGEGFSFTLIVGGELLSGVGAMAAWLGRRALARAHVELIEQDNAAEIAPGHVRLASGRELAADATLVATGARAPEWFAATDLPRDDAGFLAVRPTLQLLDDDDVFAVGDCASVLAHPRPKAGVFAVRQGPPLTGNLRRRVEGRPARPFRPQRHFLTLLSLGERRAIAVRSGVAVAGDWVWRWKDRIDRRFVDSFADLPDQR